MRRSARLIPALIPIAAMLCAGCAGPARQPPTTVHVGSAGSSAAVALFPIETGTILAHFEPGPEVGRRDRSLAVRPPWPLLATNQWPQEGRPSLSEQRRIHVPDREGTYLFFLHERPHAPWPHPW